MEIPRIEIPQIKINEIYIPKIRTWEQYPTTLDIIDKPKLEYPIVNFPSFEPLDYHPDKFIPTDPVKQNKEKETIQPKQPEIKNVYKKKEIVIPPCPSNKDQKIGDFRNDKKLLRVSGYERGKNGIDCITLYEDVPFLDQYIPSFKQFTGVFSLALVGCSAPIVLNLVKPIVKNVIKKLTKKKDKSNS